MTLSASRTLDSLTGVEDWPGTGAGAVGGVFLLGRGATGSGTCADATVGAGTGAVVLSFSLPFSLPFSTIGLTRSVGLLIFSDVGVGVGFGGATGTETGGATGGSSCGMVSTAEFSSREGLARMSSSSSG